MKTNESRKLFESARKHIPGGVNSPVRACGSVGADPLFVGQGDGCLIETRNKRLLIDGGQYARNLNNYLTRWKYKWLIEAGRQVKFDAVFVSHFDADHFAGLTSIIQDKRFEFGTIYHNGIARFHKTGSKRPALCNTTLGQTSGSPTGFKSAGGPKIASSGRGSSRNAAGRAACGYSLS